MSIGLEQHHSQGSSGKHIAHEELGEDIQTKPNVGSTLDHANGYSPDKRDKEANDQCPPGEMSRVSDDSAKGHAEHYHEENKVLPIRSRFVLFHHLRMNIVELPTRGFGSDPDLLPVEHYGMRDNCSDCSERESV